MESIKPIIAVDVDDVCIDFIPALLSLYNKDYKDNLTMDQITDWNILKFIDKQCGKNIYNYMKSPKVYLKALPVKDSLWGVNILKINGYRVIYLTVNNYGESKYEWLLNHGYIESDNDFVIAKDKSLIKANTLLDDNYENVINFGKSAWLMSKPWNIKYKHQKVAENWRDFIFKFLGE